MAYDEELAARIRDAFSGEPRVREVKMFGGLSFMVNDRITATARHDGTADAHVEHVLAELGFSSRSQIAARISAKSLPDREQAR